MGMAVILVMGPWPFERTFSQPMEAPYKILASMGLVASEKKMFENVDDDGQRTAEACLYYKLTNEPSAQVS